MNINALEIQKNKIEQFRKKGINTIEDLLNFLPRKYYDFSNPTPVSYMERDEIGCCILDIERVNKTPKVLQFFCTDFQGTKVTVLFFSYGFS